MKMAEWRIPRSIIHPPSVNTQGAITARKVQKTFPAVFQTLSAGGCVAGIGKTGLLLRRLGCEQTADGLIGEAEAGGGAEHAGELV